MNAGRTSRSNRRRLDQAGSIGIPPYGSWNGAISAATRKRMFVVRAAVAASIGIGAGR
ncbi:hypothetical protein ACFXKI_07770 [Streptomyces mirabilis]|uniref:hypothetical protein n=1 Tax=Streptomyces mirabilis TaxID=68239 RepID=UPI0036BE7F84